MHLGNFASAYSLLIPVRPLHLPALQTLAEGVVSGRSCRALSRPLRVAPLFETLADLEAAGPIMRRLFGMAWYRNHVRGVHENHQEVRRER